MIALSRPALPQAIQEKLTGLVSSGEVNWVRIGRNTKRHLKQFMSSSFQHGRCAYCERFIGMEGGNTRIDHFHPRHQFPAEIFVWENLFLSCAAQMVCDDAKGGLTDPIINPTEVDPRRFFGYLDDGEIFVRDDVKMTDHERQIAENTISVLNLNDTSLTQARVKYWTDFRIAFESTGGVVSLDAAQQASAFPSFLMEMASTRPAISNGVASN